MERLNVLSLDWDYFVSASVYERMNLFPDGGNENLSSLIGNMVWSSHYCSDDLVKIKTDSKAIRTVKKILKMPETGHYGFQIMDSHKYAYDFIMESCNEYGYDSINLVNVDYHHDVYSNGTEVDCGNWLEKIIKKFDDSDSMFTWVARRDSDMNQGQSLDDCHHGLECTFDLDILEEYNWDIVFICRSAMWSPPHLDRNFRNAFQWIIQDKPASYQSDIFKNRYSEVLKFAKSYSDCFLGMNNMEMMFAAKAMEDKSHDD